MESIKIKIALMGLGSAGTRHAIALSHFPEITIFSVVDGKKKNSYDLLQNKYKTLLAANYYDDDDKMFTQEYFDAIVVSADPISTMGENQLCF
ncbi:MAG: Gfo/Idh/MocA family oxidoreductase [Bacteroidetes bacterium]|nr:Gfo/Idh/MocA family oxidoreductase [Bacteroidota bacterium]